MFENLSDNPERTGGIVIAGFLGILLSIKRILRILNSDSQASQRDKSDTTLFEMMQKEIITMKEDISQLKDEVKSLTHKHRKAQTIAIEIYAQAYAKCPFCQKSKELAKQIYEDA